MNAISVLYRRAHKQLPVSFPTGVTGWSSVTNSLCQELNLLLS